MPARTKYESEANTSLLIGTAPAAPSIPIRCAVHACTLGQIYHVNHRVNDADEALGDIVTKGKAIPLTSELQNIPSLSAVVLRDVHTLDAARWATPPKPPRHAIL
jgi:hypothetical protein